MSTQAPDVPKTSRKFSVKVMGKKDSSSKDKDKVKSKDEGTDQQKGLRRLISLKSLKVNGISMNPNKASRPPVQITISPSGTLEDAPVSEIGHPFNVNHNIHVEFTSDVGYTGLPLEWRDELGKANVLVTCTPTGSKPASIKKHIPPAHPPPSGPPISRTSSLAAFARARNSTSPLSAVAIDQWDNIWVLDWLTLIGFPMYRRAFLSRRVDGPMLLSMTIEGLTDAIGVNEIHAKTLMTHINTLRNANNQRLIMEDTSNLQGAMLQQGSPKQENDHDHKGKGKAKNPAIDTAEDKPIPLDPLASDASVPFHIVTGLAKASSEKIFGVPLNTVMAQQRPTLPGLPIPVFIYHALRFIRTQAINEPGIFRLSPGASDLKVVKDRLNRGWKGALDQVRDPHVVSCLLKHFLRELPSPLITRDVYPKCIRIMTKYFSSDASAESELGATEMRKVLSRLPASNFHLLESIMWLLYEVGQHQAENQMTAENLGRVFGATMLWQNTDDTSSNSDSDDDRSNEDDTEAPDARDDGAYINHVNSAYLPIQRANMLIKLFITVCPSVFPEPFDYSTYELDPQEAPVLPHRPVVDGKDESSASSPRPVSSVASPAMSFPSPAPTASQNRGDRILRRLSSYKLSKHLPFVSPSPSPLSSPRSPALEREKSIESLDLTEPSPAKRSSKPRTKHLTERRPKRRNRGNIIVQAVQAPALCIPVPVPSLLASLACPGKRKVH
eukprot:TRINITY_DN5697_c0_g1_i5.p1 TRINITY_DN5697_c0_g1~~TRINITY_DN5697_c0_g1_i5.p1  ORF type:complete len:726 (-),score=209.84 TRINITY_DN5697_c0_g1_i5:804-2981(-)